MSKVQPQEIYGLFSIANEYYQPDNNLVVLWGHVPSFQEVQKVINMEVSDYERVLQGESVRILYTDTDYRLQQVTFGEPLPER